MSKIICTDVYKTFTQGESKIKGLDNVTLTIAKGEFVCLSGQGAGGEDCQAGGVLAYYSEVDEVV